MKNISSKDAVNLLQNRFFESRTSTWFISLRDHEFSYNHFWHSAKKLAEQWKKQGVRQNDVVALILPNSYATLCCYLACIIEGFVVCPIVNTLHASTIKQLLKTVNPKLVIDNAPDIKIDIDQDDMNYDIKINQEAPFLIMFTSGATGVPKAICHCLRSVIFSAYDFGFLSGMSKATRLYHILPMTYMAGFLNTMLSPLMHGGVVIEGSLFSPSMMINFWERPLTHKVNTLSIIPSIASALHKLTRDVGTIKKVQESIRQIQCTSAPIQMDLRKCFMNKFNIPLQDCYGLTELGGPLTFQDYSKAQTFMESSIPLDSLNIDIRNNSELWIRSPYSMLGYIEDDGLTCPFDDKGFMNTGDLAEYENGKIKITGRVKDIIIRGGINVSPSRLESILSTKQGVDDVAVVGHQHEFWGEEIIACIISKNTSSEMAENIHEFCRKNLGSHELPDRILFMDSFPRSFIGKLLKNTLREQVQQLLETKA